MIRERRELSKLSRAALAMRAGISESTLKNLESGRHQPSRTTLMQLCAVTELKLNLSDLLTLHLTQDAEAGPPLNCWLAPGFDPIAMAHDLTTRLNGRGGHIEQTYLYLDTKSAACWCAMVNHPDYASMRDAMPLREVAARIQELAGGAGLDLIGLGCGDGREDVRLAQMLLQGPEVGDLRLYLLDISQPLLGFAYKYAADTLADRRGAVVFAIQGDFHRLPCYTQLLYTPQRAHRRRVICMFGGTFGNLENELRFLRNSLVGLAPGDLMLLSISPVAAPLDRPEEIAAKEPRLSGHVDPDYQRREREFLIGPIERYARPAGAPLADLKVVSNIDTTACTVPGSYAIETSVVVKSTSGEERRFSMVYIKRYDPAKLEEALKQLGWDLVGHWHASGDQGFNLQGISQRGVNLQGIMNLLFRWRG